MISQLYLWRLEDFLRAWHLLQEPLVMQAPLTPCRFPQLGT